MEKTESIQPEEDIVLTAEALKEWAPLNFAFFNDDPNAEF